MPFSFPPTIKTQRLLLRPWRVEDAPRMKAAIDANLDHLRAWMPWALNEPSPLEDIATRIAMFAEEFEAGSNGVYAIFSRDGTEVIGGTGLHPRIESGLEIGYWIARAHTRNGYATEAARALTESALTMPDVAAVQIRCDPRNIASAGVPAKLGYRHIKTFNDPDILVDGSPRATMVWQISAHDQHPHLRPAPPRRARRR
ncbi:MAG: GNAT family N-acetyltransferase [Gemmatimonadota bacterium]|nr:GNAT family N-acetyltransferase [Gemmatimonadota bacterium]